MNLLKNFKKDDILMLVVAFLLGYFAHRILKGCQIVEGADTTDNGDRSSKWKLWINALDQVNINSSEHQDKYDSLLKDQNPNIIFAKYLKETENINCKLEFKEPQKITCVKELLA